MSEVEPPVFREVLRPTAWVWVLAAGFAAALGVAYGYAYGAGAGWAVGGSSFLVLALLIGTMWRVPLEVSESGFRADRAVLPLQWVGRVAALDAEQSFRARTAEADARAFLMLRTWASNRSVIVEVTDPEDPHPYWLVSTRRPEELAAALIEGRDRTLQRHG